MKINQCNDSSIDFQGGYSWNNLLRCVGHTLLLPRNYTFLTFLAHGSISYPIIRIIISDHSNPQKIADAVDKLETWAVVEIKVKGYWSDSLTDSDTLSDFEEN